MSVRYICYSCELELVSKIFQTKINTLFTDQICALKKRNQGTSIGNPIAAFIKLKNGWYWRCEIKEMIKSL